MMPPAAATAPAEQPDAAAEKSTGRRPPSIRTAVDARARACLDAFALRLGDVPPGPAWEFVVDVAVTLRDRLPLLDDATAAAVAGMIRSLALAVAANPDVAADARLAAWGIACLAPVGRLEETARRLRGCASSSGVAATIHPPDVARCIELRLATTRPAGSFQGAATIYGLTAAGQLYLDAFNAAGEVTLDTAAPRPEPAADVHPWHPDPRVAGLLGPPPGM